MNFVWTKAPVSSQLPLLIGIISRLFFYPSRRFFIQFITIKQNSTVSQYFCCQRYLDGFIPILRIQSIYCNRVAGHRVATALLDCGVVKLSAHCPSYIVLVEELRLRVEVQRLKVQFIILVSFPHPQYYCKLLI